MLYNEETTSRANNKTTTMSITPHGYEDRGRVRINSMANIGKHIINVPCTLNKNNTNDTAR